MKRKCINTLVAALTIMTITTTSALPAFAEPYDNQEVTSAVSENNNCFSFCSNFIIKSPYLKICILYNRL